MDNHYTRNNSMLKPSHHHSLEHGINNDRVVGKTSSLIFQHDIDEENLPSTRTQSMLLVEDNTKESSLECQTRWDDHTYNNMTTNDARYYVR